MITLTDSAFRAGSVGRSVGRCRMRRNQVPPRQALACMGCFLETPLFGPTMDTSLFCLRAPLLGSLGAHICPCCECGEAKKEKNERKRFARETITAGEEVYPRAAAFFQLPPLTELRPAVCFCTVHLRGSVMLGVASLKAADDGDRNRTRTSLRLRVTVGSSCVQLGPPVS